jgi:hypothetical protein
MLPTRAGVMGWVLGFIWLLPFIVFGIILYVMPTVIAVARSHRNATSIGILNFFLGWTILGWIFCLIWAFSSNTQRQIVHNF